MIYLTGVVFIGCRMFILIPAIGELAALVAARGDEWIANHNAWTSDALGFPNRRGGLGAAVAGAGEDTARFAGRAFGTLAGIASSGVTLIFNLATIAMCTFYLTAEAPRVQRAVLRLFPPAAQQRIR